MWVKMDVAMQFDHRVLILDYFVLNFHINQFDVIKFSRLMIGVRCEYIISTLIINNPKGTMNKFSGVPQ